jgi:hypothetical protein
MKKISLLLIFCFLFQGCVGFSSISVGSLMDDSKVEGAFIKNKICNFEEVLSQKVVSDRFYRDRFLLVGSFVDMGLSIYYFFNVNPSGLVLFANGFYAFTVTIWFGGALRNIYEERSSIYFSGWQQFYATECKEEYFIFSHKNKEQLAELEKKILRAILNYPHDYNVSQDQNFSHFQKDFLRNNKIQTYSKDKTLYYYIHYPGGKAKFEEDFGKYLFKQQK